MEINRQYIGARYVPKFYEGSNGTEWDENHIYEPLTIVTYLNNSYTSKKSVPASIGNPMANPEYWAATGNYNAQVEEYRRAVNEYLASVDEINALINSGRLNKFAGKRICIVGDSLSDNTTYPPNWTTYFTTAMEAIGATVVNVAHNGYSIVGISTAPSYIPTNCDVYVLMLGINDTQGQFKAADIYSAFGTIYQHITQSGSKEFFFISPIKCTMSFGTAAMTPKIAYRHLFEKIAKLYGMTVISGYNAPILNALNASVYLADTLHASTAYAPILADYILRCMIDENETFTGDYNGAPVVITPNVSISAGAVYFQYKGGAKNFVAAVNLAGAVISTGGWVSMFTIGTNDGLTYGGSIGKALINRITGEVYQTRLNGGDVEVYFPAPGTFNIDGTIVIEEFDIHCSD